MFKAITPFSKTSSKTNIVVTVATWATLFGVWLLLRAKNPVIPSPSQVASSWVALGREGLLFRLWESYGLNLYAMLVSTLISFSAAYLAVVTAFKPTADFISKLRFIGFTGLTFLLGMYAEGRTLQVWMLVFGISTFYTTSMLAVVASIPQAKLDHARTLKMSPWRMVWEVVVHGTLDDALDVLRQSAAIGWVMLTMVEGLVRSQGGIGVVLIDLNRRLKLDGIIAVIFTILVIGITQDFVLNQLRLMICPYSKKA